MPSDTDTTLTQPDPRDMIIAGIRADLSELNVPAEQRFTLKCLDERLEGVDTLLFLNRDHILWLESGRDLDRKRLAELEKALSEVQSSLLAQRSSLSRLRTLLFPRPKGAA